MVKVIKKKLEGRLLQERNIRLAEMAIDMFDSESFINSERPLFTFYVNQPNSQQKGIFVDARFNQIDLFWPRYFEKALMLAEAYEQETGEEFTIKEDFDY